MSLPKVNLSKKHFIILGIIVIVFIAWRIGAALLAKPVSVKEVPMVRTVTVGAASTDGSYTYPGEVRGHYESNLAFQVAGKIIERRINLGDSVQAGQVLMVIDPKDVNQEVTAGMAAVASAQASYKLSSDNNQRYQELYQRGAVSQMIRDQYQTQYEAAASTLQQAQAKLTSYQNQLGYTQLTADHDGTISSLTGEVGQVVAAGTPVATLIQNGEREIQIFVPENRLGQIQPGQQATITFWALSNIQSQGHVTEIAPMADSVTRTYKVKVAVDQMPAQAKLGMTAKVTLNTGTATALILPSSAIYQTGDQAKVWIIQDLKAHLIPVQVAGYEGSNIKIASGLNKGDIVVTGGINKLAEGMTVRLEDGEPK